MNALTIGGIVGTALKRGGESWNSFGNIKKMFNIVKFLQGCNCF